MMNNKNLCACLLVMHGKMNNIFEKYLLINSQRFSQISNVVVEGRLLPIFIYRN